MDARVKLGQDAGPLPSPPHRRRHRNPDQQALRPDEAADRLARGLLAALDQQAIAARFQRRGRRLHILDIEFEPGLRDRNPVGPAVVAEAGLRRLGMA